MENYHLIPEGKRWVLICEGSTGRIDTFNAKQKAVDRCTDMIREQTGSLNIHMADGTIEERRAYRHKLQLVEMSG